MDYTTITFYKYIELKDVAFIKKLFSHLTTKYSLLGRILIGEEGINAGVSGMKENVSSFKQELLSHPLFSDLTFREQSTEKNTYHKLVIHIRKEIVVFGKKVDLTHKGTFLTPKELHQKLQNNEDLLLIDARNSHEAIVGKFRNALTLPLKTFREFAEKSEALHFLKNKNLVLYCTGGIRCEKASAYLKEQGFTNVSQLQGGILDYVQEYPQGYFEGNCFVFDDRLVSRTRKAITHCVFCSKENDTYLNCFNLDCDKLFICCSACQEKMHSTCSEVCKTAPRQRILKKEYKEIGIVQNYYAKARIALIKVKEPLSTNTTLTFLGKTTQPFQQPLSSMKNYTGQEIETAQAGELITLPVHSFLRKNDKVVLQ